MPVNQENGLSVYYREDIAKRETYHLYRAVRELAGRFSRSGTILDLGCGDFPTSRILQKDGFNVVGIDLDESALRQGKGNYPSANLVLGDLRNLPISEQNDIDVVFALDVLEHLEREEAADVLRSLASIAPAATIIASMPIISKVSIPTYTQGIPILFKGKRPETGLFDRTHKILTDTDGHKAIFSEAGYDVVEEYRANWIDGVTGEWEDMDQREYADQLKGKLFKALGWHILPRLRHPFNEERRDETIDHLTSRQALYVLQSTHEDFL